VRYLALLGVEEANGFAFKAIRSGKATQIASHGFTLAEVCAAGVEGSFAASEMMLPTHWSCCVRCSRSLEMDEEVRQRWMEICMSGRRRSEEVSFTATVGDKKKGDGGGLIAHTLF